MKQRHIVRAWCYDKRGRMLSSATNNYDKSHPLQAHFAAMVGHHARIFLHAEIAAILRAKEKPIHKIRIERLGKQGQPLPSKPCPVCMEAIRSFGIKEIQYAL